MTKIIKSISKQLNICLAPDEKLGQGTQEMNIVLLATLLRIMCNLDSRYGNSLHKTS